MAVYWQGRARFALGQQKEAIEGYLDALKAYLLTEKRHQFTQAMVRKTMAYALGRYLDFTDSDAVNEITQSLEADNYRMHTLLEGIILSKPFRTK